MTTALASLVVASLVGPPSRPSELRHPIVEWTTTAPVEELSIHVAPRRPAVLTVLYGTIIVMATLNSVSAWVVIRNTRMTQRLRDGGR